MHISDEIRERVELRFANKDWVPGVIEALTTQGIKHDLKHLMTGPTYIGPNSRRRELIAEYRNLVLRKIVLKRALNRAYKIEHINRNDTIYPRQIMSTWELSTALSQNKKRRLQIRAELREIDY